MNELLFFNGSASEEALLRSTLIYNSIRQKVSREDVLEKAVYAVLFMENTSPDIDGVRKGVYQHYSYSFEIEALKVKIDELKKKGLVSHNNYSDIHIIENNKISSTLNDIDRESVNLVSAIYKKAEDVYHRSLPNKQNVKNFIRRALTYYLRSTFLELFELQKVKSPEEKEDIIKEAMRGLGNEIGEATVRALSEILIHPSPEQQQVLVQWSKAFLTLQIMDLDPALNEFKESKLQQKSFVIDTDVALHCLCSNTRYSQSYKQMTQKLRQIGCKLYVPKEIIQEIGDHIDASLKWASSLGEQLLELPDETLESGDVSNVFIEDYVKTVRLEKSLGDKVIPFNIYYNNLGNQHHRKAVLMQNLYDVFGEDNIKRIFKVQDNVDEEIELLVNAIHEETLHTPKAENRTEEGNREISRTDALLYVTVKAMNEECDPLNFFANKTYILTSSSRTRRCAMEIDGYEKKIICHPQSLYSMLEEIGEIKANPKQLIELLDNPYMTHVSEQLWKQIEPILKQNQAILFETINALKNDVNLKVDGLLTSQNAEETVHILKKFGENSLFGRDIIELKQKLDKAEEEIRRLQEENDKQKRMLNKKEGRTGHYQSRIIKK